jgi:3-methyladenine DNA glycosylase AlkD
MLSEKIEKEIYSLRNQNKSQNLSKFFKTQKGEYSEGDLFLGIAVPQSRKIVKKYYDKIEYQNLETLINHKYHEVRFIALNILVLKYEKEIDPVEKEKIVNFYLKNLKGVNNWDLVDSTAYKLLGPHLIDKDKLILYKFAESNNLWENRISIISTLYFIKNNQFNDTLDISQILLTHNHDLIHKAVGWMLREMGKKDKKLLLEFLNKNYLKMPRTMLRYAIEKLSLVEKKIYMKK